MDRRSLNPVREAWLILSLARLLRRERPIAIHNFTIKCAAYGTLAARLAGVPGKISAVAGLGYVFSSKEIRACVLRPLVSLFLRLAMGGKNTCLIVQNREDLELFRRTGVLYDHEIRLIRGSGVSCSTFRPRTKREVAGKVRILLASRLLWDKGLAEYAEAARLLHAMNIQFLLAGAPDSGNPASVCEATIKNWEGQGVIEWLGHVDDMSGLLNSVDIVVLPSYYGEGLPRILIEAAACGLPIVTTDVPGCREVVTHDVDGLIVPPRDPNALASAIARLVAEPATAARLGAAARERALREFNDPIIIDQTLQVYDAVLDKNLGNGTAPIPFA